MKKQKINAGKASVLVLTAIFVISAFLLGKSLTSVSATTEVCFCHNVNHNPHTICTSNQGEINGHSGHVNNGSDTLGACASPTPIATSTATATATATSTATVTATATSTSSGEPTATPTSEPTTNPDVCLNLDGVQTGVPDGLHLGADGTSCVAFSQAGVQDPTGGQPQVQGQVLGASTMAKTGTFAENLYLAIMTLGGLFTFKGLKNFKKAFKKA